MDLILDNIPAINDLMNSSGRDYCIRHDGFMYSHGV